VQWRIQSPSYLQIQALVVKFYQDLLPQQPDLLKKSPWVGVEAETLNLSKAIYIASGAEALEF
jgi:hypothetical protein